MRPPLFMHLGTAILGSLKPRRQVLSLPICWRVERPALHWPTTPSSASGNKRGAHTPRIDCGPARLRFIHLIGTVMQVNWKGLFPAVTTKLNDDGSLDHNAIEAGLNRLIDNGVGGVVMMGMVGENAQLSAQEKRTVLKIAVETVNGRVPVISGLAETNTASAIQFAQDAEQLGVQGLM